MTQMPTAQQLYQTCEHTWPAAATTRTAGFDLRNGAGGGQRVSAATLAGAFADSDLDQAETAMRDMDQNPLFMIRAGEDTLDAALESRGYAIKDPVNIYACPIAQLTDQPVPRVTAFTIWEPLQIMLDIWATGGIGPERVNVMSRCTLPKTALLGRWNDHPSGTGYIALDGTIAMVHALEILEHQRGQGVGKWMMRQAAFWAQSLGAQHMSVICTQSNAAANGLYTSLGMQNIGSYHYRVLPN